MAGNREFGIQKYGANYIFYIQAIDRLWSPLDEVAVGRVNNDYFFALADKMWRQVMSNVANEINKMGGQATFNPSGVISKRISYYNQVSQEDQNKISSSRN